MNIKPTGSWLLVEKLPVRTHSPGGILLPQIREFEQCDYKILACGPKAGSELCPGQRIGVRAYGVRHPVSDGREIIDAADVVMLIV